MGINQKQSRTSAGTVLRKVWTFLVTHKIQILIFLLALVVLFFRRPDIITNPQFWAEDGASWFADAVNSGYSPVTLLINYTGYLTVIQRLVGLLSGFVPMEQAPLFFNMCALGIQALVLVYLWSKRANFISKSMKIFMTFIYLCMPFTEEVHGNTTNSQWFLGLLLFLLLFIEESKSRTVRYIDCTIIVIASLSGPFSILLMPIIAFEAWRKKKIETRYYFVAFGAAVQVLFLLFTRKPAEAIDMGYSITKLFNIVGGQVFGAGLFGPESYRFFTSKTWVAPVVTVLGIQLLVYVFIKSNYIFKYFIIFSSAIFITSLFSVLKVDPGYNWWYYFTTIGFGGRYYFMLHFALFMCLGWLVLTKVKVNLVLRAAAALVLALSVVIGMPSDFIYKPYKDLEWGAYVHQYKQLPKGEEFEIPVNPEGPWKAVIVKR